MSGSTFRLENNNYELTYNINEDPPFFVSSSGSSFQLFTYTEGEGESGNLSGAPINIGESTETQSKPLTAIYRNQHVKINIVFQDKSTN